MPPLSGTIIHLRELTSADMPGWFARATDLESAALAGDPVPASVDSGSEWLARSRDMFHYKAGIRWAIVPKNTSDSAGTISLILGGAGTADLGFVVARASWGQGFATDAGAVVIRYAFEHLGLTEIRAEIIRRNDASRRVLEKLGFQAQRSFVSDFDGEVCLIYALPDLAG